MSGLYDRVGEIACQRLYLAIGTLLIVFGGSLVIVSVRDTSPSNPSLAADGAARRR